MNIFNLIKISVKLLLLFIFIFCSFYVYGGKSPVIHGVVRDKNENSPVGFATVSIHLPSDSSLVTGTVANEAGHFVIKSPYEGNFILRINFVGYSPDFIKIELKNNESIDLGDIYLEKENYILEEASIMGERLKAKSTEKSTVYYMNRSLYNVSSSGADLLKQIPGARFDLMQNFSIEGKENVLIYVNGREKDMDFVRQLDPEQVDRVEVNSSPGAEYNANTGAVINLVLKEKKMGLSGHLNAELPTSPSEIYLFPSYGLNYGREKFNLYTSYNGEFSYFDIRNTSTNLINKDEESTLVESLQDVRQKNWAHRFHAGMDYFFNDKSRLNLYTSFHPYSWEQDGTILISLPKSLSDQPFLKGKREDTDRNLWTYYSVFYEYLFNNSSTKLTADINYSRLRAENKILFHYEKAENKLREEQLNQAKPARDMISVKTDFNTLLGRSVNYSAGIKANHNIIEDLGQSQFQYQETNFAVYNSITGKYKGWNYNAGLRVENTKLLAVNSQKNYYLNLLPTLNLQIKLSENQNLKISYRRSVETPNIYQLNPAIQFIGPYRIYKGNPDLEPSLQNLFKIEHSLRPGKNFISSSVFYQKHKNAIAETFFVNDSGIVESVYKNPGNLEKYGLQISGSWRISNFLSLNHYIKFFSVLSRAKNESDYLQIPQKSDFAIESSLSAIVNFNHNISFSMQFQYNSPVREFQLDTWNDPLYFCSIEKNFENNLKIGISTGLPFKKEVSYYSEKVEIQNLDLKWNGKIQKSLFPVWLKISYKFQSGKKLDLIEREKEVSEEVRKKGF